LCYKIYNFNCEVILKRAKFFHIYEFQRKGKNNIKQIRLSDNLADLFTKSLPASTFKKLAHNIGMCHLKDLS
jgi:hypothetical protein